MSWILSNRQEPSHWYVHQGLSRNNQPIVGYARVLSDLSCADDDRSRIHTAPLTAQLNPSYFFRSSNFSSTSHLTVMDPTDLLPLLEQLDDNVDDLEAVLQPLLTSTLLKNSNKLPVMDKAKLHVLITYTLESLIFCTSHYKFYKFTLTNEI